MTQEEKVAKQLDDIKTGLEATQKDSLKKAIDEVQKALEGKIPEKIQEALKTNLDTINDGIKTLSDWKTEKSAADEANQKAIDQLLSDIKEINKNTKPASGKSFGEVFTESFNKEEHEKMIDALKAGRKYKLELKAVGNMTLASNLTGDSVATYSQRQALLPAQPWNFRDLARTVNSDTGLYIHYRESAGEGSIGTQTEGSAKSQIDFDFTEVKTVNEFVAGFARVSRQIMRSLPYLQQTLPALLLREFYKAENSKFITAMSTAATGTTTTVETDDVKTLMDLLTNQRKADFVPSAAVISHNGLNKINKLLYDSGNQYVGQGGVLSQPDGSVIISGTRIIPASWMPSDDVFIYDQTYLERIEVEGVKVEFFEQDSDNVQKNLLTARIECYEAINLMLPASAIYTNLGNASF